MRPFNTYKLINFNSSESIQSQFKDIVLLQLRKCDNFPCLLCFRSLCCPPRPWLWLWKNWTGLIYKFKNLKSPFSKMMFNAQFWTLWFIIYPMINKRMSDLWYLSKPSPSWVISEFRSFSKITLHTRFWI